MVPRRITVNAVCPGWTGTEMARQGLQEDVREAGLSLDEFRRGLLTKILLAKIIKPGEVAELVSFLKPPETVNITVQALNISGGLIMS